MTRRLRWRTRYRFWRQTGMKLGTLAKKPGTSVREVDGRVWITETGYATGYDEAWEPPTEGFC